LYHLPSSLHRPGPGTSIALRVEYDYDGVPRGLELDFGYLLVVHIPRALPGVRSGRPITSADGKVMEKAARNTSLSGSLIRDLMSAIVRPGSFYCAIVSRAVHARRNSTVRL